MSQSAPDVRYTLLPHKPTAPLAFTLTPGKGSPSHAHLVVFFNGLIVPQTGWFPALAAIQAHAQPGIRGVDLPGPGHDGPLPPFLTYDRYGQGGSARDPSDETHGGGHDVAEVVRDLHILVKEVCKTTNTYTDAIDDTDTDTDVAAIDDTNTGRLRLVFVASSIGCVIARLYAQTFPRTVLALLLLDSNMASTDPVSLFPDPDAPGFDPGELPGGVGVEVLRRVRMEYAWLFGPSVPNAEHLDRRNVATLLPYAGKPALEAPHTAATAATKGPWLVVVGHDPERFAEESERGILQCPTSLTYKYVQTAWARYNQGMLAVTQSDRRLAADGTTGGGVVIAKGCGHFVMRDDPDFVARWVVRVLMKQRE